MEYQKALNNYHTGSDRSNTETLLFFNDNNNPSISRSFSENNGVVDENSAHTNLYLNDSISIKRSGSLQSKEFNPINSRYKNIEYSEKIRPNQHLQKYVNINQNLNSLNSYEAELPISNKQGHKFNINSFPLVNCGMSHCVPTLGEDSSLPKVSVSGLGITQGVYIDSYKQIEKSKNDMDIPYIQKFTQYKGINEDNNLKPSLSISGKIPNSDSKSKKRPIEPENESKKAAREHANKKMRNWRRKKAILNRLNDMRCRVYMECRKKYGNDTSKIAKDWIRKEMDERIARTDFKKLEKKQEVYSKSIADKNEQIKPQPIKDKKNSGFSPNQYEKNDLINQLKSTKNESQTNARFSGFGNYSDASSGKSKYVQKNEDKQIFFGLKRDADSEINNEAKRINIKTQVHKNFYGINDLNAYPIMKKLNLGYTDTTSPIIYKDIGFVEGLSSNLCRNKSKFNSTKMVFSKSRNRAR
ncbi:hypothetical protein AYI69_g3667 [Smittium culicis]|uniref:DUF3020 domain-containing protein n=1 Tax=Smittium culicis TaxID=133412 RepID=A0A1R1YJ22_9FUNG|nr:hypothetical protein AYI69_g3667 [Smittium culicis]